MSKTTRREFLKRAGGTWLAIGVGSKLGLLAGCDSVSHASGRYDAIIIGGGTASTIVAAKLQAASGGRKRILIIEAGGPTAASIGGQDFPPWLPPNRTDLTIFDVPGEYSQLAFMPFGAPYQLTNTPFTYQGIGLGGNSQFNGMLFQTNSPLLFDTAWPAGWSWADMEQYFERVRQNIPVSNTPSTNGVPQNTGPAQIIHPLYESAGWVEGDTSRPFAEDGIFSRPYVATEEGRRAGPISGYFEEIDPGGVPVEGLEILEFAKADQIEFDSNGRAVAVHYLKRPALDQNLLGQPGTARLKPDGLLIMAAGALVTPRLLLLSGVGPFGLENEIFPEGGAPGPFTIDNQLLGVGLFDHVMSLVAYNYDGDIPYQAYNYGDYSGHEADLEAYLANGSGPYAQYQPVSILNYRYASAVPNVEIFLNPNGPGPTDGPYYGPRTFCAFLMLLNPQARGMITLDANENVRFPNIYMPDTPEGNADADLMAQAVFDMIQLFKQDPALSIAFGPGSPSHPTLNPDSLADVRTYVTSPSPVDDVFYSRLIINHYGGTARLTDGPGGVNPETLILRGTENVAVVDASLIPTIVPAHPVGTIMSVADRAGDILAARWHT